MSSHGLVPCPLLFFGVLFRATCLTHPQRRRLRPCQPPPSGPELYWPPQVARLGAPPGALPCAGPHVGRVLGASEGRASEEGPSGAQGQPPARLCFSDNLAGPRQPTAQGGRKITGGNKQGKLIRIK